MDRAPLPSEAVSDYVVTPTNLKWVMVIVIVDRESGRVIFVLSISD